MLHLYGSLAGIANLIFTGAIVILTAVSWQSSATVTRVAFIFLCGLFPLFQPATVYFRAKKQAAGITQDTELTFDETGIDIRTGEKFERLEWRNVKRVSFKPGFVILFTDAAHGYILPDRVLGVKKRELTELVKSRTEMKKHVSPEHK